MRMNVRGSDHVRIKITTLWEYVLEVQEAKLRVLLQFIQTASQKDSDLRVKKKLKKGFFSPFIHLF